MNLFFNILIDFIIFIKIDYPIVVVISFVISSTYYRIFLEKGDKPQYLKGKEPFVTIAIPAHNEELSIEATVEYLVNNLNYPADKYEIIVIDDASNDGTVNILQKLQQKYSKLRLIAVSQNRGKAHGLNVALAHAKSDYILVNDADSKPEPDAVWKYLSVFEKNKNLGAVTGNMLPSNRTSIVAIAQQNELNSIIGLIKRSQLSYGGLFAFSGANTMYYRPAVIDVGGWAAEQPTEDIAIAWDMKINGWKTTFAPHIRFFLDVPENLPSLIKQRKRWSSGGIYVLFTKGTKIMKNPLKNLSTLPIIIDYAFSFIWSFFYWISMAIFILSQIYFLSTNNLERFFHNWYMVGIFVAIEMVVGIVQLILASYYNDSGKTLKYILFAPWYMLVYWMVNTYTVVTEFFPTLFKVWRGEDGGTWTPPERSDSLTGGKKNGN